MLVAVVKKADGAEEVLGCFGKCDLVDFIADFNTALEVFVDFGALLEVFGALAHSTIIRQNTDGKTPTGSTNWHRPYARHPAPWCLS
jgi:hypothetical protein